MTKTTEEELDRLADDLLIVTDIGPGRRTVQFNDDLFLDLLKNGKFGEVMDRVRLRRAHTSRPIAAPPVHA